MAIFNTKKEPTEMERAIESLNVAEKNLQDKIYQLGQMFYMENKDNKDIDPKYLTMIDLITKLDENRKGFYQNKLRLEGQMMCANCGGIIPYGSVYCSLCGKSATVKEAGSDTAAPFVPPTVSKVCPKCGAEVEDGCLFCTSCGTKID